MTKDCPSRGLLRPAFSLLIAVSLALAWVPRAECGAKGESQKIAVNEGCCAKHSPAERHDEKTPAKRPCAGCLSACCATAVPAVAPPVAMTIDDQGTPHYLTDDTAYTGSITHSIFHPPKAA